MRIVILFLCAIAAVRVFIFAAAFPFFNNVDERPHVDLVIKYAHGDPPHGITNFSAESARYILLFSTPEYFLSLQEFEGGQYPPPTWLLSPEQRQKILDDETPFWESRLNHESGEPPLYYAVAGAWLDFGRVLGLSGLRLLYWVRFLNIAFAALLVWIGFAAARSTFPENQFLQIGIAAFLSLWPQSAFYSVQGDALSPLFFGFAFLGLTKMLKSERPEILVATWSGLAVAATCLVKTSNLPLPAIATAVIALKIFLNVKRENRRRALISLGIFISSFAVPIGIWFAWNHYNFGDLTATKSKIELLGWTQKPFNQWWPHPIFGWHGISEFWPGLIASFWRGEFVWQHQRMASPWADATYAIATALVIIATMIFLFRGTTQPKDRKLILSAALVSFLSLIAFLVLLSMSFDFGQCPYPSREHPYFTSGRLLNATAVPFFLLFVFVIDQLGNFIKRDWLRWVLLGATVLFLIVSQVQVNMPAFSSRYNFFHRQSL